MWSLVLAALAVVVAVWALYGLLCLPGWLLRSAIRGLSGRSTPNRKAPTPSSVSRRSGRRRTNVPVARGRDWQPEARGAASGTDEDTDRLW